jgi:intracellular septation protein A
VTATTSSSAIDGADWPLVDPSHETSDPPDAGVEPNLGAPATDVSVRGLMLGGGPRFARDAFGPVLAFYVGWKLAGLVVGIVVATVVSLVAFRYERKRERSGTMARVALVFVLVQGAVGLLSNSAKVYLAQPVLMNAAFGLAFLVSVLISRPLAGVFAEEMTPFPPEVKASDTFRRVFGRISIAWGVYLLLRSALRLFALSTSTVEDFLVVNFVTGLPLTAGLMAASMWYGVRSFRRSAEWGWAFEGEAAPQA